MNIALIGMRGSGKTTVAKLMADKLNMKLIVTDELIEKRTGLKINQFVKEKGWQEFRRIEKEELLEIAEMDNLIIDTGGGIVENLDNQKLLKKISHIIWLKTDIEIIIKRLKDDAARPLLTKTNNLKQDLINVNEKRKIIYKKLADYVIIIDGKKPLTIAKEIIKLINNNND